MTTENLSCNQARQKLVALLDGELSDTEQKTLQVHLAACIDCGAAHRDFATVKETAQAWQIPNDAELNARFAERMITRPHGAYTPLDNPAFRMTAADMNHALSVQKEEGGDLGDILLRLGLAKELDVYRARAEAEGIPFIDLQRHKPEPSAFKMVPPLLARQHSLIPVKRDGNQLWLAMKDPHDIRAIDDLRMASRCMVAPMLAIPSQLDDALDACYGEAGAPPTPAAPNDALLTALEAMRGEMAAMHGEIDALREEVSSLRKQISQPVTATATISRHREAPHLMPYAPPGDLVSLLG